jgi:cytochrome c oxidase subunit II
VRKALTVRFRPRPDLQAAASRLRKTSALVVAIAATAVLSSCASDAPQDTFKPDSPATRRITRLAWPVFTISVLVGLLVYGLVLYCIIKFRRKSDDHVPKQVHGNTKLELFWGAVPAVILAVVGVFSVGEIFNQAAEPKNALNITVIGHQWWWEYQYPMPGTETMHPSLKKVADPLDIDNAKEEGREPKMLANVITQDAPVITSAGEMHIPAGRNVRLLITSDNVMHNFWVPKLAGKIYAIPGKINRLTINSDPEDAGKIIYGQCAEFCGTSHANMRFKVVIDSPADYDKWLANQASPAVEPTSELAKAGKELFYGGANCTSCHWQEPGKTNGYEATTDKDGVVSNVKKIGPNLSHIGARRHFAGAIAELNTVNLKAWLRNPQEFKPGSKMVIRKLSEDEVNKLVAYIESQK